MPAAVQEPNRPDYSEQMWRALKAHILRERARKKQEREQEVEEERLRKEREAREQQDVMTLGQTREQLAQLEKTLSNLKEEKHQLFIQLKKVLNEDDNRRRQLRDNMPNEPTSAMEQLQQSQSNLNQQLYIPSPARLTSMPQQQPQQQAAQQSQAQQQSSFRGPITKRIRSPSPAPQVPVSLYHSYGYKPPTVTASSYQGSPQKDDGRRNELARAVLWNKAPQYTTQPSAFYPVPPQEIPMYYSARGVFDSPRPLSEHYAMRTPVPSHGHIMHSSLPINPSSSQQKGGSITAGYPVRTQPQQYQQSPGPSYQQSAGPTYQQQQAPGSSVQYTTQSRPLYQPQGGPMNYNPHPPQRE